MPLAYNSGMSGLILYSTLGCHLCELAMAEIHPVIDSSQWRIREVDIADDPDLMERYGDRIPVLFDPVTEKALFWPFDRHGVKEFLAG